MTLAPMRPSIHEAYPGQARDQLGDALVLEQAEPSSWRVCDGRISSGDGRYLAFIERRNDVFELMQVADDFVWTGFPTMKAALAYVVETHDSLREARSSGIHSWVK